MLHDICDHGSQPVSHPAGGPCQEGGLSLTRLRAPRPAMNAGIGGLISPRRGQQAGYTESLVHIRKEKQEREGLGRLQSAPSTRRVASVQENRRLVQISGDA